MEWEPNLRPRFSIRAMLGAVTVLGMCLASQLDWIRQRNEMLAKLEVDEFVAILNRDGVVIAQDDGTTAPAPEPVPPAFLWLYGEKGVDAIFVERERDNAREMVAHLKKLFPEARVAFLPFPWSP